MTPFKPLTVEGLVATTCSRFTLSMVSDVSMGVPGCSADVGHSPGSTAGKERAAGAGAGGWLASGLGAQGTGRQH